MLRKAIYLIGAVVAVLLAGPMLPLELAVWFSGELLLYLEVVSGVWLASQFPNWRYPMRRTIVRLKGRLHRLRTDVSRKWPSVETWVHGAVGFQ